VDLFPTCARSVFTLLALSSGLLFAQSTVNLSSYYNVDGIASAGKPAANGGFDGTSGYAYNSASLGTAATYQGVSFSFGPANALDAISSSTVPIPSIDGYNQLYLLGAGTYGAQPNQRILVTYTDGTSSAFTQTMSDWWTPGNYAGETIVSSPSSLILNGGTLDSGQTVHVYGYTFNLAAGKTAASVTLPANRNAIFLAIGLGNAQTTVNLSSYYNVDGIAVAGKPAANGGFDGTSGYAYNSASLGTSATYQGVSFSFGPANALDAISSSTVPISSVGGYNQLYLLGAGTYGAQANQRIVVTYTDGTTSVFSQTMSDWWTPGNYPGETTVLSPSSLILNGGTLDNGQTVHVYGYTFNLAAGKTVASVTLPANRKAIFLGMALGMTVNVTISSGNNQTGQPRSLLSVPMVATITNAFEGAAAGVPVTVSVLSGNGGLLNEQQYVSVLNTVSDGNGQVIVQFKLGPNSGEVDTIEMTAGGSSVIFSETAQAAYVPGLIKISGDNQSALPSALLPRPLMVNVLQAAGSGVANGVNVPVQFSVFSGGAQIQATQTSAAAATLQTVSDALGRAWVYVVAPPTMGTHAIIRATSGSAIVDFLLTTSTSTEYSNRNKVYQYQTTFPGANGEALLWIPEGATVIRGVLFMRQNIPEGIIAGDPMIRAVCAKHGLAILYGDSQVWYDGTVPANVSQSVTDLKGVLATLAAKSGYAELANVPWLPIGESFSIAMVQNLRDATPSRTLAAIFVNDIDLDPSFGTDRTVPTLAIQSTMGELVGQNTVNLTTYWSDPTQLWGQRYHSIAAVRGQNPNWPLTVFVEPAGSHFDTSDWMVKAIANYIDLVATARLDPAGSNNLVTVQASSSGVLADLPIPGVTDTSIQSAASASNLAKPWFFNAAQAALAQSRANTNWNAATQIPLVGNGSHSQVTPFDSTNAYVTSVAVSSSGDFTLNLILLSAIPAGFVDAGSALANSGNAPVIKWMTGSFAPEGLNAWAVDLSRWVPNWFLSPYFSVTVNGNNSVRYSVQPFLVNIALNTAGTGQSITFGSIPNTIAGNHSTPIALYATSTSGAPVSFGVEYGPAVVENGQLVLTPIPPRSTYPIQIKLNGWQWGSNTAPLYGYGYNSMLINITQ
jgi:hypothetical protein